MAEARAKTAPLPPPLGIGALALRDKLATGAVKAADVAEIAIARIEAREGEIGAFAFFDPAHVREQAARLDAFRGTGRPLGPLHGVPVGVKDIIDTARIPTENGAAFDKGRVPAADAFVVERLKAAGALILGKTVTTELAFLHPAKTRNPANPDHTPGGSSSGSAAAVADGMAALAIGTQTGGSIIRPASYCGVTGFKPTFGAIPRRGILAQSPSLDTVGVFSADVAGAALLADALFGHDDRDPATAPAPAPRLLETALSDPPLPPVFAFLRMPGWDDADPVLHAAFDELKAALGDQVFEVDLPPPFAEAVRQREIVNYAEMAKCLHRHWSRAADLLGAETRAAIEEGNAIPARDYLAALDWRGILCAGLDEVFSRCDAILCPAATGPAPRGLGSTGSSIFNGLWTFTGTPAVTLPLLADEADMPMGVQIVGSRGNDARLLRTARWLEAWAASDADGDPA